LLTEPKEGEKCILVMNGETFKTSPVEKVVSYDYAVPVWVAETRNTIYMLSGNA